MEMMMLKRKRGEKTVIDCNFFFFVYVYLLTELSQEEKSFHVQSAAILTINEKEWHFSSVRCV